MRYFIVFQNQAYNEERKGGYLWAPQENNNGKKFFHWTNMTKVKTGDVVLSSFNGQLVAVSKAQEDCIEYNKPSNLDKNALWQEKGWRVKVDYHDLESTITFKNYKDQILEMQAEKYAPFNKNGGGNQGYLFEIGSDFGSYLIGLAKENQSQGKLHKYLEQLEEESEEDIIKEVEDNVATGLNETEKKQVIKVRLGQGKFRSKLEKDGCKCKICGLANKDLLVASHIKPWKDSTNKERIDFYNGFLLCPGHDALFDKGYISFNDEGKIIVSESINNSSLELMNICKGEKINISKEHKHYLNWHRLNILR